MLAGGTIESKPAAGLGKVKLMSTLPTFKPFDFYAQPVVVCVWRVGEFRGRC